jgi:hypothetical protein
LDTEDREKIDGLMAAVVELTNVMSGHSNVVAVELQPANAHAWSRLMPRLWLNPSFKFPVRFERARARVCVCGVV